MITLFSIRVFGNFPVIFLLLVSPLIPLCSENTFCVISVLLGLWWFISWPRLWSVLVNVLWTLENNMYFVVVRQSILQMLSRSHLLMVSLSSSISLLILLSTCFISCWERSVGLSTVILNLVILISVVSVLFHEQLVCTHLGLFCLLGGLILLSFYKVPLYLIICSESSFIWY